MRRISANFLKSACYDSVLVCLCKDCQMYNVCMSTRMPVVPRSIALSTERNEPETERNEPE